MQRIHVFIIEITTLTFLEISRSRSYFMTDGQSVSQSVCLGIEHPCGPCDQMLLLSECCCMKFVVLFLWGTLSDEKTGLQFAV
jgi:hypothetical protein